MVGSAFVICLSSARLIVHPSPTHISMDQNAPLSSKERLYFESGLLDSLAVLTFLVIGIDGRVRVRNFIRSIVK